jgi:hypothetical protein
VGKARYLIAVSGEDGTNAQVAFTARLLSQGRHGPPLTCFVDIVDVELCSVLTEAAVATDQGDGSRLEFFNVYQSGPRPPLGVPAFGRRQIARGRRLLWRGFVVLFVSLAVEHRRLPLLRGLCRRGSVRTVDRSQGGADATRWPHDRPSVPALPPAPKSKSEVEWHLEHDHPGDEEPSSSPEAHDYSRH